MPFHDRREAGRVLASRLGRYAGRPDVLVLALPRGVSRSPSRWPRRWGRRWTSSSCASWGYPATRKSPWARSPAGACGSLATGASMKAAVAALRRERPARIVVAVPVAAAEACDEFRADVEDVVCVATPEPFMAVGAWYEDFSQTTDEEVRYLLDATARISGRPVKRLTHAVGGSG